MLCRKLVICKMASKVAAPSCDDDIVISGMSGQFPNSRNVKEYIEQLLNKVHLCDDNERRGKIEHPEIPKVLGKIYDEDQFDPGNFGVHSLQAKFTNPMVRLLLEQVYSALFDAGIHPEELKGSQTGVFTGCCFSEYEKIYFCNLPKNSHVFTGATSSLNPQKVSYYLQLNGPSYNSDTACSSSMYALEEAYRSIREGRCNRAIVAGTNLCLDPSLTLQFARLGALNMGEGCRPFDNDASGYTRSEAIVAVILQKQSEARRVYGNLAHSKTNADGYKPTGITYPSSETQLQLLKDIYSEAQIDAKQIGYLEAHGTGTKVGDPEELSAIDKFYKPTKEQALLIGSVKGNIGHTEPSAGLCSLVKILHILNSGQIPPNIHFDKPRDIVEGLIDGRLKVVTDVTQFPEDKLYAGINCFGFGGANAHAIVRKCDKVKQKHDIGCSRLICYSGRTQAALDAIHDNIVNCKDVEFLSLLQESFKANYDTHLYRGYTLYGRNLRSSTKARFSECNKIKLIVGSFNTCPNVVRLNKVPIYKQCLENNKKNFVEVPIKTVILLMILHSLKELELSIDVFEDNHQYGITKFFNNQLSILELSKTITKPKLNKQIVDKWIKTNSVYSNYGTIIVLGSSYFNGYFKKYKKCNLIEFGDDLTEESCLCNFGQLHQLGFNPQVHKLYSDTRFPVGKGTAYLSHILKWRHKNMSQSKFNQIVNIDLQRKDIINIQQQQFAFLQGHIIDNRNLFPATGYIYQVWKFFADMKKIEVLILNVMFENVIFHRACTIPATLLELHITITKSGYFEVIENDSIVVTGTIRLDKEKQINIDQVEQNTEDSFVLSTKDAYRELRLRGYNYNGQFRAIQEVTNSSATIKWEHEWITFLDNMMQVCILHMDTRNLYVPVAIDRMVIHAREHHDNMKNRADGLVKVYFDEKTQSVRSQFVEIRGLVAKAIARRKERLQPVLETYQFVPNEITTDLATSIRINIQLLLECKPCSSFKVAELIGDNDEPDNVVISHICSAIEDIPVIIPHLTVVTNSKEFEVPNCKTVNELPEQNLLIVCKHPQKSMFTEVDKALTVDGFLLCLAGSEQIFPDEYTILTKHVINNVSTKNKEAQSTVLYLLRKRLQNKAVATIIDISKSKDMSWLTDVQTAVKTSPGLVLLAQNDYNIGILGFTNCLNREPGLDNVTCVFIQDKSIEFDENNNNSNEIIQKQLNKQMTINVFKDGQWGTYRHLVLNDADKVLSYHWYANPQKPGDLSSLAWVQGHISPENKESPKILCSALNFRDLMLASGKLSLDTISKDRLLQTNQLGLEFVSIDSRGKRMCSMGTYGIGNISDHVYLTYDVPNDWTTEEAATILVVYSTVLYAIIEKGQLQRGQSVLIHSGAGGVGLAAINVCTYFECNIFVTVGTQEKRDYLIEHYPNIKPSQIGNSRNTTFREMIMHETNGKGVDVVLNSLAEEKLQASVDCLAFGAVFLEIGKYDLEKNNDLTLELAMKECRYFGVMLDSCVNQKRNVNKIATLLKNGVRNGYVKPLPRTVFQIDELEKACKYMSTGKHIGKVLIKIDHEREHKVLPRYYCDPTKCYIIFGGLGGFGLELVDWLILRGAKHIVLSSRQGITTGYQQYRISIWKTYGVKISILMEDVTNYDTCYKVLKDLHNSVPIDGIFNLAVVLSDAVFENQTIETMKISMQPKAVLTQHLDTVTRKICPKMKTFVVFSSVSCGRGNAGQTNYGYANSVMERICEQRHLDGLSALAVQWGAVGDVGLLESLQKDRNEIAIGGTLQQKIGNCLEVLDKLLLQKHPIVSSMVVAEKFNRQTADSPLQVVSHILGINDVKSVGPHTTLPELGMDSMMAIEIKQSLEREYDIVIAPNDLRNLTFAKLEELTSNSTAPSDGESGHTSKESVVSFIKMLPILQLSSRNEQIIDFNKEASTVQGDFVLVFPGTDGEVSAFENMSKSINRHFKIVSYDNISTNQESVDVIVDYVYNAVKDDIESYKSFKFLAHSIGNLSAIELVKRFESNNIYGKLILIDGAPELMYKLYETQEGISNDDFAANLIRTMLWTGLPGVNMSRIDKILTTQKNFTDRVEASLSELLNESEELRIQTSRLMHSVYSRILGISEYKTRENCTKLQSKVWLFKPNIVTIKDIADDYNLRRFCQNVKSVDLFDGDHLTMLHNEQLHQALFAKFNNSLE